MGEYRATSIQQSKWLNRATPRFEGYPDITRHWFTDGMPEDVEVFAKARDIANGQSYRLPFKVFRKGNVIYNAKTRNPIAVPVAEWSYSGVAK